MKGQGHVGAHHLSVVYPDTMRKDRQASAGGQVPLVQFATDAFKDDLAGQLATAEPGPWHVHISHALRGNFGATGEEHRPDPPHLFFEQLVAERRSPRGKWEKPHQGVRNEATDLMVGAHVIAHLLGLARIDWSHPPAWAEDWDRNSMLANTANSPGPPPSLPGTTPQPGASPAAAPSNQFARLVGRLA